MQYMVDYLPDKDIVTITMTGRLSFQIAEKYSVEAVKLGRQHECNKFLFDHTETIMQSNDNIYASGGELQEFGFGNTDRIAIVLSSLTRDSSLREPVTQNSRWSTTKYFNKENKQKAYDWLQESE